MCQNVNFTSGNTFSFKGRGTNSLLRWMTLFCKVKNVSMLYKLAHVHNTKFQINGDWKLNILSQIREHKMNKNFIRSLLKPSSLLQAKPACCSHRSMFIWYNWSIQNENVFIRLDWTMEGKKICGYMHFPSYPHNPPPRKDRPVIFLGSILVPDDAFL